MNEGMTDLNRSDVVNAILPHLGDVDADRVQLEAISTGKFNESWFVHLPDRDLVLRVAPPENSVFCFYERGMMRQEPELHGVLREKTNVPVAEVVGYEWDCDILDRDFILMERLPGRPLSEVWNANRDDTLRQLGGYLHQVHLIVAESGFYGYLGEHHCMEAQATWAEAFRVMWGKLLEDVEAVGMYSAEERDWLCGLFERDYPVFDREVQPCLLHMDVWDQNILVDNRGAVQGIVDWDRALWGDVEIEFAVLDYCGISRESFWEGYGGVRDISEEAGLRRIYYLLYELQKYMVIRLGRNADRSGAEGFKRQCMDLVREILA